jgi:hypothetical protein
LVTSVGDVLDSNPERAGVEKPSEAKTSELMNLTQKIKVGKRNGTTQSFRFSI